MKVGVNILNFGPGVGPDALAGWAQAAETLGYHSIFISDHVAMTPSVRGRYPEPYYDPFATLAWLAGQVKRVQIGTTVIVLPYRNAILTARLVANIDQFSGGRFIFGIGVGGFEDEFATLGVPFKRRGRLTDETLEAMFALWAGDGPVSYHGRLVHVDDVSSIAPVQRPRPPIWVGGWSEAALQRTATYGDGWHPILFDRSRLNTSMLDDLRRMAEAAGRPEPQFCPRIRLEIHDQPLTGERRHGAGSLAQVRADLQELQDMGAEHVVLDWFTGDLEATRNHNYGWHMLAALADKVLDLKNECVR